MLGVRAGFQSIPHRQLAQSDRHLDAEDSDFRGNKKKIGEEIIQIDDTIDTLSLGQHFNTSLS